MGSPDIVIAGAGLIGLSCALECRRKGLRVTVLEKGRAGQEASWAAAGMLAAHDPANPPALQPLSDLSLALYPSFLQRVAEMGGVRVSMETEWALEQAAGTATDQAPAGLDRIGFHRIPEQSLDPRKLAAAVLAAVRSSDIDLQEGNAVQSYRSAVGGVAVTTGRETIPCGQFLDCTGAWSKAPVRPAKGQMLRLYAPGALAAGALGNVVVRTPDIYLVPRLDGTVVVGATVEDVGFDKTLHDGDLDALHRHAAALVPVLRSAPRTESWAGLRPATADLLPLMGSTGKGTWIAAGHFRNGVLLAPATAHLLSCLLCGEPTALDLRSFSADRFTATLS